MILFSVGTAQREGSSGLGEAVAALEAEANAIMVALSQAQAQVQSNSQSLSESEDLVARVRAKYSSPLLQQQDGYCFAQKYTALNSKKSFNTYISFIVLMLAVQ